MKISVKHVDGGWSEWDAPAEIIDTLRALEAEGFKGKALIHKLITDDWGAPPLMVHDYGRSAEWRARRDPHSVRLAEKKTARSSRAVLSSSQDRKRRCSVTGQRPRSSNHRQLRLLGRVDDVHEFSDNRVLTLASADNAQPGRQEVAGQREGVERRSPVDGVAVLEDSPSSRRVDWCRRASCRGE
jgi:hypothetical protein